MVRGDCVVPTHVGGDSLFVYVVPACVGVGLFDVDYFLQKLYHPCKSMDDFFLIYQPFCVIINVLHSRR